MRTALVTVAVAASNLFMPAAFADISSSPARSWGTNGRVNAIAPIGDRIFVGGSFTATIDPGGVVHPAHNLAVFSASTGRAEATFDVGTNNTVFALATDGAILYLGGTFGTVTQGSSTVARAGLAAVDVATGAVTDWSPSVSGGQVDAVAVSAATGWIYAAGNFSSVSTGASTSPHPFVAKIDAATGAVDTAFAATPADRVRSLNIAADGSGRLFLGGDFLSVSAAPKTRALAAVTLDTGAVSPGFAAATTNQTNLAPVYDIVSDAVRVYVAAAGSGGACTALSIADGALVWTDHSNGNMQAVRLIGSTLYCGGHFSGNGSFLTAHREKLAAVDATTGGLLAFNPRINTALGTWALGTQPNDPNLYLGGDFTSVTGVAQPHFAIFLDSTRTGPPQPPGTLVAQPADGRVLLSWAVPSSDDGAAITSYSLYRGLSAGGENLAKVLVKLSAAATTYTDLAVTNGTAYFYVVAATNSLGRGPLSNEATATPGVVAIAAPGPPDGLTATNPPGTIELDWNPPTSDGGAPVTGYEVYRGLGPADQDLSLYATGVTNSGFSDAFNVVAGTTYYYRVTALNTAGESPWSNEVSAVEQAGKAGPPELSGALVAGAADLAWAVPPDGGSPILKYVLTRDGVKLAANLPATQTTYHDATIGPGQVHVYQVKAVTAVGGGQNSNKVTITS